MMLTYFFVIIRCLKNKTQIFLAVCKIQCTFAAKLVFHNLYNHNERGISSDAHSPFLMSSTTTKSAGNQSTLSS